MHYPIIHKKEFKMKKLHTQLAIIPVLMSLSAFTWAMGPCMPIAKACMMNGYYKGGDKVGKGLVKNCVMPIVAGNKTLPSANFTDAQKMQCGAEIKQKLQGKMQANAQ
jgi:hypothetical protein